jgi:hypothetical protein
LPILSSLSITGNEFGKEGRQKQLEEAGYKQTSEFAPSDENGNILRDPNLAKSSSSGPVEDVSEDFSKMNRGQDVITESERIKKLEQRLNEEEEERMILRREIDDLKNEVKVLKEKTMPELLRELQEKFVDAPGLIDVKKLQKAMYLFSIL